MRIDYGYIGLSDTAAIMEITEDELIDGLFESWAPIHEFTGDNKVRFRWTDVWVWRLNGGSLGRTTRKKSLYE